VVKEGKRPTIPLDTYPSLLKIIQQSWHSNPDKRPLFCDLLSTDVYQHSISEALAGQQNVNIKDVWSELTRKCGDIRGETASWKDFKEAFASSMKVKENDKRLKAIYALLDVNDNIVTWTNLHIFIKMFGVLKPCGGAQTSTLDLAWTLIRKKWFWGDLEGEKATQELQSNGKIGSFLVRFSSKRSQFVISFVKDRNLIRHTCLRLEDANSLINEVAYHKKFFKLKKPIKERPAKFECLFKKKSNPEDNPFYVQDQMDSQILTWTDIL